MSQFIHLILKYKNILAYIIFGVCTTLVNIVSYWVCCEMIGIPNIPAVIIAWILAVDLLSLNPVAWKAIANLLIILTNLLPANILSLFTRIKVEAFDYSISR